MKALGTAERAGGPRFVRQQIYYSLQGREAEYELIPAAVDQGLGYWSGARWPVDCSISCPASGTPGGRRLAVVPACRYRAQDVHPVPPLRRADGMMPVAVVFLDRGAAGPTEIVRAARGLCETVLLYRGDREYPASIRPVLRALGGVDIAGMSDDELVAAVRQIRPAALVTYSEHCIEVCGMVAERLGLRANPGDSTARLVDKSRQRIALCAAGVPGARWAPLDLDSDNVPQGIGLPAVVKPTVGAGSRDTYRVDTAEQFAELVGRLRQVGTTFLIEELLVGDASVAGHGWGDYVSVESVVADGRTTHVAVVGKLPLAEPFRETGMMLPATLSADWTAEVLDATTTALRALGVVCGVTQTELKLTAAGPRVIEVNGRTGGYIPWLLHRGCGIDLIRLALAAALGTLTEVPRAAPTCVPYQYFPAPPVEAKLLNAIDGVKRVRELPGVERVDVLLTPGSPVDARLGTVCHPMALRGVAADHDELRAVLDAIDRTVVLDYR